EVADRPTSQRHHGGAAVETGLEEAVPGRGGDLERLGPLSLGEEHGSDVESRVGKAPRHRVTMERQDGRIGDEGDLAAHLEAGKLGSRLSENARADEDAVRAGAETNGDVDHGVCRGTTTSSSGSRGSL